MRTKYLDVWILIALLLFGSALYSPALKAASFYFDDVSSIENDTFIKKMDIPKIFNAFNTRFLAGLSFALNYKWCGLHPFGYRAVNLLIHGLNAFLVYLLVKSTLYLCSVGRNPGPAFFASMLFLCHPIQTEPVNFITQRFVLMAAFFYLASLYFYVKSRTGDYKNRPCYILSLITAIAAMFCKEFTVTLPLMLALYDFYFLPNATVWKRCKSLLPFFVIVLIVPLLLLRTPHGAIGVANIADSDSVRHIDITRARGGMGRGEYFLTELNVVRTYVRLLFLPINQNLDYDYPLSYAMDGKTLLSGVFLLCLLATAVITYKSYRIISFGILWFFIALSVESSFIPIGHVIAEYRLYLASVGFVLLVTALIYMVRLRSPQVRRANQKRLNVIAAIIIIGFSIMTYQRNKIWKSEFSLWNDVVEKSPHKARGHNNRGLGFYNRGDFLDAIVEYNKAVEINPDYTDAYNNLGILYTHRGDFALAKTEFDAAIDVDPNYAKAYHNRGLNYARQGRFAQAIADYNKAIALDPNYADAYNNRGVFYVHQGHLAQATSDFAQAIDIDPDYAKAYYNRGLIYAQQGHFAQAMADYNKAIELNPDYLDAYYNRGLELGRQKKFIQALADYNKYLEIKPHDAQAYNNRAFIYYQLRNYDKARDDARKAEALGVKVNPAFISALGQASGRDQ